MNKARLLLANVRQGDYAHPGDEEAIELLLSKVIEIVGNSFSPTHILDAGCGLGGTANYIKNKLETDVHGIDIDSAAISHAKNAYPHVTFTSGDLQTLSQFFAGKKFQLIYMFNVFYAIQHKIECLKNLADIAESGAILAIFDYAKQTDSTFVMKDLSGNTMRPLALHELSNQLFPQTGWKTVATFDMTDEYIKWYQVFLQKLATRKDELLQQFSVTTYNEVQNTFNDLLTKLNQHELAGVIVIGKKEK